MPLLMSQHPRKAGHYKERVLSIKHRQGKINFIHAKFEPAEVCSTHTYLMDDDNGCEQAYGRSNRW